MQVARPAPHARARAAGHFNKVYMCRMLDDLWTRYTVKSRWMDETAGGCTNFISWRNNNQWLLFITCAAHPLEPPRGCLDHTRLDHTRRVLFITCAARPRVADSDSSRPLQPIWLSDFTHPSPTPSGCWLLDSRTR